MGSACLTRPDQEPSSPLAAAPRSAVLGGVSFHIAADRLDQLVAESPDLDLVPVAGDIATEAGVRAVVAAAGGRVDALANVAGIMDAFLPPAEVDDATWERVFAVNVTAVMRLTRAVLPIRVVPAGRRRSARRRPRCP
jgi:NAD(P)-dependent dehydrogenase (short-subunit alcohol dehydrogenase family)